jgi:hypothetical protein
LSEAASTDVTFAPSELVILFGDRFAPEGGLLTSKEEVMTSGVKVSAEKLMNAAMKAAFYAVHRSGAGRLELRAGTALFGLRKTQNLFLLQGTGTASFPRGSLEAFLLEAVVMEQEVEDVLKAYIGEEVSNPPQRALGLMKRGMSERGLLEVEMKKAMMVFTTIDYALPAATRMAAEAQGIGEVQALLRELEREPGLDVALQKEIDSARVAMTSSND